jgi:aspartate aminotransferase-like enzyme
MDPRFVAVMDEMCQMLGQIFQTKGEIIPLVASSRGGMEAAVTSVLERGDEAIFVLNGVFGEMFLSIGQRHGIKTTIVQYGHDELPDLQKIEDAIKSGSPKALLVVHNESSTGAENPAAEIGKLAREHDLIYILDCVSSMGGVDIKTDQWGVDICVTGSQKALGSLPGLAIVSVNDRGWQAMKERKTPIGSYYFDLWRWMRMWVPEERGGEVMFGYRRQPVTMGTHLTYALHAGTKMIMEEGLEARFARHARVARAVKAATKALGLKSVPHPEMESKTITAFHVPDGLNGGELLRTLRGKYGVHFSGGLEALSGKIVRIGHMGNTAAIEYAVPGLSALELVLSEMGYPLEIGAGLAAFHREYGED